MRIQEKKVRRGNSFHMPLSARPPLLSRHSFYSEFVVLETCIKEKKEGGKRVVKQHPETSFFFLRFFLFPFFTFRSFSPGIQIGADSFITKPFSPIDVDARLRAFLRTVWSFSLSLFPFFPFFFSFFFSQILHAWIHAHCDHSHKLYNRQTNGEVTLSSLPIGRGRCPSIFPSKRYTNACTS
mmetsp:Transcript_8166/g.21667  ORF Transcript_8166/g.21667 Transcript_8166/m.21667 type:complete len:182 (+) Transcript_8166:1068-1613(+)